MVDFKAIWIVFSGPMKKTFEQVEQMKLVGLSVRTNNAAEMSPEGGKITATLQMYAGDQISDRIKSRVKPGVTYAVYTDYESDHHGDYTYFVGELVESFDLQDPSLQTLIIPASQYVKFEVGPGKMPDACIGAWQEIWHMSADDFGGERAFTADFEVYDERAADFNQAVFDIYISLKDD